MSDGDLFIWWHICPWFWSVSPTWMKIIFLHWLQFLAWTFVPIWMDDSIATSAFGSCLFYISWWLSDTLVHFSSSEILHGFSSWDFCHNCSNDNCHGSHWYIFWLDFGQPSLFSMLLFDRVLAFACSKFDEWFSLVYLVLRPCTLMPNLHCVYLFCCLGIGEHAGWGGRVEYGLT